MKIFHKTLIILAFIFIVIGVSIAFFDVSSYICLENDGLVSSLFSLASAFLFLVALLIQQAEYKLQNQAFNESAKAQKETAQHLEKQKEILIEQTQNSLIVEFINNIILFKKENNIDSIIDEFYTYYRKRFYEEWKNLLTHEDPNKEFAERMIVVFTNTLKRRKNYHDYNRYTRMIVNTMYVIEQNSRFQTTKYLMPYLRSQFSHKEYLFIFLTNITETGIQYNENIRLDNDLKLFFEEFIRMPHHENEYEDFKMQEVASVFKQKISEIETK